MAHIEANDVFALKDDFMSIPQQQGVIVDYFLNAANLDGYNYGEILSLRNSFSENDILWPFFDDILAKRESQIQDKLCNMTIEDVGLYYTGHPEEEKFLTNFLENTVVPTLENADYRYVRKIHDIFKLTKLSKSIDKIYIPYRNEVINGVLSYTDEYFKQEKEAASILRSQIDNEIYEYIDNGFKSVIQKCFEDKLPAQDSSVITFIESQLQHYLSTDMIRLKTCNVLNQFINESNSARKKIIEQIIDDVIEKEDYSVSNNKIIRFNPEIYIDFDNLISAASVQNEIDWISWGLTAASFIPYVGVAADVADFFHSIKYEKDKAAEVEKYMNNFTSSLYDDIFEWYRNYISGVMDIFEKEIIKAQSKMQEIIYEKI